MNKINRLFLKDKILIFTLIIFLLIGLFCWLYCPKYTDFGLNFFTEILGVAITVFIIDRIIKNRDDESKIPYKLALYEDVKIFTNRYINFWVELYRCSVPEEEPKTIELFFSDSGMAKIFDYLYMDSEPNVYPQTKMFNWIFQNAKEFKENGSKIIQRHFHTVDPDVYRCIHHLSESIFISQFLNIPSIIQFDNETNYPRIKILKKYSIKPKHADYNSILGILRWCDKTYNQLRKYDKSITRVSSYSPMKDRKTPPNCMIPDDILYNQLLEFAKYKSQNI